MNAHLVLALLLAGFMIWLIHLFFLRGRRRGGLLAFGATALLFCVKPTLDRLVFRSEPGAFAPDEIRPGRLVLPARLYAEADATGIPQTRQETWPDDPLDVHMLVELPQSGVLGLSHTKTHFRRFTAERDLGSFLIFGGLPEAPVVMPDVQGMVRDLAQVSRAE